jgi:hypothetical protein
MIKNTMYEQAAGMSERNSVVYKLFVGELKRKAHFEGLQNESLRDEAGDGGLDSSGTAYGPVSSSCELCNEPSGSTKC